MAILTQLQLVTPEQARIWLERNTNRSLRIAKVRAIAKEITDGNWRTTHQGIAFFEDGSLADGQHRLSAIVSAGRAVEMLVTYGMTTQNAEAIDFNLTPRRHHDVFALTQSDTFLADSRCVAMVGNLIRNLRHMEGGKRAQASVQCIRQYYLAYRESIDPIFGLMAENGRQKGNNAAIASAYVPALYRGGAAMVQIERFHSILLSGFYNESIPGERNAALLRNAMLAILVRSNDAAKLMRRTQRALQGFVRGEIIGVLRDQSHNIWDAPPVPWRENA